MIANMRFMDNFSISRKNFAYNRYYTLVTAHLVDHNILDVGVNSCLLYYFGREFERAFGNVGMLRALTCTSLICGLVLSITMLSSSNDMTYIKISISIYSSKQRYKYFSLIWAHMDT